jgi:hypothetical protein
MPGPRTPNEALRWIRVAVRGGQYIPADHFDKRLKERGIDMHDVLHAVGTATEIQEYHRQPDNDGTCWRVFGNDIEGEKRLGVGVEAFLDATGKEVMLCTVLPPEEL